jgi:hypothetical protein
MAVPKLSTRKQLLKLIESRATSEWRAAARTSYLRLLKTDPNEAAKVRTMFEEIAGRYKASTKAAKKQLITQGVLPAPPLPYTAARPAAGLGKGKKLLASALSSAIRRELTDVVDAVLRSKSAKYKDLVAALGNPDPNEWAAMLRKAITWAPAKGDRLAGQVRALAGQFLERLRKSTAVFRNAPKEAGAIVDAHNELARKRAVGSRVGKAREAAERQFHEREAFGRPQFLEDIVDGDGKLLSDGMRLAFNPRGRLLVSVIEEVKLESVAADVLEQFDDVLTRIKQRGMRVNGEYFPPDRIDLPVAATPGSGRTGLVAYLENAKQRPIRTPKGYTLQVVPVPSAQAREFAQDVLNEWRRSLSTAKSQP